MAVITGKRSATFIDMTPMVDLAFLLLTFFVLTTNLNQAWTLKIEMPSKPEKTTSKPINQERALTLVLADQNRIYWYAGVNISEAKITDFSAGGIRKLIAEKKVTVNNLYVLIKPSDKSQYKNVIDILDEMLIAGQKDFSIVDLDPLDKELIDHY